MNVSIRIATGALVALLLFPAAAAAGTKRPRPSDVPGAQTSLAPNDFQIYNDYTSPERTYSSRSAVVHYVVRGIDAPPLNDDDGDGVPDYVARVGAAADRALAYYERRGFLTPLPDRAGPDSRPDLYVSRFAPGTFGVAFPADEADGGAFVALANNLDPSADRSLASIEGTVAHELFHVVQFSYFGPEGEPAIPAWILEGTAAALESRVDPALDDLVSTIQLRRWFSATERSMTRQTYGAQLLWLRLDTGEPRFLPTLLARLAAHPVTGDGRHVVASTYERVTGQPFSAAFHRFAVSVAEDRPDDVEPARGPGRADLAALSVRYLRAAALPGAGSTLTVAFPHGRDGAAATLVYRLESSVPGAPPRVRRIEPRVGDGGRTLTFAVSAAVRRRAVLVLSNGGERAVGYAVGAR
jgi:hypothetical protein